MTRAMIGLLRARIINNPGIDHNYEIDVISH